MSADVRLKSHDVCVSNMHDISLKGLQVLHLQDICVRLAIVIPNFQGNHFLSCEKIYRAGKYLHPNVPPSEGVYHQPFPNPFVSIQLSSSRDLVNVLDPWTHSKAAKKFKGSKTLGGKRQAQPLLQHSSWMIRKFCEEQKVVPTLEPRAVSGGYLNDSWLMSGIFQQKIPEVKDSDEN